MSTLQDDLQPLVEHLIELRTRLMRAGGLVLLAFIVLFNWSKQLFDLLAMPMLKALPQGGHLVATDVTGSFFVPMKVAAMAAFLLTLPHTLYQAWAFIAPGLYRHEKRLVLPLVVSTVALFAAGMAFAYFLVFPVVFKFMAMATPNGVTMMTDIDNYLSFVLRMFLAFGITFETPVVVLLLVRMGFVSVAKLSSIRPYIIVAAFVIASVVTPPDALSMTMLALPLWFLYELGVVLARWLVTPQTGAAAGE